MFKRVISRLDVKNGNLVKGINLEGLRNLGDPEYFVDLYYKEKIDEIHFQDIVATLYNRDVLFRIIEKISKKGLLDSTELFAPVVTLENFHDIDSVISEINSSKYGLTSAIHTNDINISDKFSRKVRTGVVNINLGTYGSEPHMPFGGFNFSGNGTREPGLEALNFYSDIKVISNKNYDL